jgi:hypothetical protein
MEITARTLLASVSATAVLGGAVGALATAAATSQATPSAIAAAVQRVSDQKAEQQLHAVNAGLAILNMDSELILMDTKALQETAAHIDKNAYGTCWAVSNEAQRRVDCLP